MTTEGPDSAGERLPRRRRRAWFWLILAVFSLGVSELASRVLVLALDRRPLLQRDPVTGWGLQEDLDQVRTYRGGGFAISTDPLGRRRTAPAGSSPAGPSILVVGDSFAQGLGVADQDTFAWVLGDRTGRRVVNLGVLGFESAQELAALRRYLAERPDEEIGDVILLVFDNDLLDCQLPFDPAIGRTRPLLGDESYSPAWVDVLMDSSRMVWLVNGVLAKLRGPSDVSHARGLETVESCVREIRELAASRGARTHVVAYRRLSEPEVLDSVWLELLERCRAVDLTPVILAAGGEALIGFDGLHWNAAGHGVVAARLLELLGGEPAGPGASR